MSYCPDEMSPPLLDVVSGAGSSSPSHTVGFSFPTPFLMFRLIKKEKVSDKQGLFDMMD